MEIEFGTESRNLLLPLAARILPWIGWFVFAGSSQLILKSAKLGDAMEDRMVQIIPKRREPALVPTFKRGMNVWQGDGETLSGHPHEVAIYQKQLQAPPKPFGILEKHAALFLSERLAEVIRKAETISFRPPVRLSAVLGTFSRNFLEPYTDEGEFEAYVPEPSAPYEDMPFVFAWETTWEGCRNVILPDDDVHRFSHFPNPHETAAMVSYSGGDQDYEEAYIPMFSEACVKALLEAGPDLVFSPVVLAKGPLLRDAMAHEGTADRMFKSNSADDAFLEPARKAGMPEHEAGNFFHDLLTEAETDTCSEFYEALHPDNPEEVDLDAFLPMWNY